MEEYMTLVNYILQGQNIKYIRKYGNIINKKYGNMEISTK